MKRLFLLSPLLLSAACGSSAGGGDDYATYNACIDAETKSLTAQRTASSLPQGPFAVGLSETNREELTSAMRDEMKASMRMQLEAGRATRIATLRCEYLKPPKRRGERYENAAMAPSANAGSAEDSDSKANQASGTNNQVAGVDEADFVKNDNKYIYIVNGSQFRVIEAWPAPGAHEIANVTVPGTAKKLFVEGNRALVYSSIPGTGSSYGNSYRYGGSGECTYGASGCVPSGDGTETEITVFDITNRAAPRPIRSLHSSSSLIAARRIGNAVHTVLGEPSAFGGASWRSQPENLPSGATESEINAAYDGLAEQNAASLDRIDLAKVLPRWTDSASAGPEQSLFRSSIPDGRALTSVLSLDLGDNPTVKVASVISRAGWVYASPDALYMAVPHQQITGWGWFEGRGEKELSTIHEFAIGTDPRATTYRGTGVVKGRVINQLAMDEHQGHLRVATTTGHLPDPDAHNTISILGPAADAPGRLDVVGIIDHIAKSEDIRSVRFDGDRGYIVTFKKTDPLFVFDLADPRAPKTMGELKIPGFSTYMHMMDATHLLTIGYDAADQGGFAYFTGVLLQIFDVSNPADPRLTHKEIIGTRGSSSEALTNHLAFNYFAPKNLLALPMTICEGGNESGGYGSEMTFSGLMVYDTTAATGFSLRGQVAHPNTSASGGSPNGRGYYDTGCSNWWTDATSAVKRSIIMDDWVFSVSETRIKVNSLTSLATDVKELSLR